MTVPNARDVRNLNTSGSYGVKPAAHPAILASSMLVSNGRFAADIADWTTAGGGTWSWDNTIGRQAVGSLKWVSGGSTDAATAQLDIPVRDGVRYRITGWVKTSDGFTGSIRSYMVGYAAGQPPGERMPKVTWSSLGESDTRWVMYSWDWIYVRSDVTVITLELNISDSASGSVWFDDFSIEALDDVILRPSMAKPRWRNKIHEGESRDVTLEVQVQVNESTDLPDISTLTLAATLNGTTQTDATLVAGTPTEFTWDATGWPAGKYPIIVRLYVTAGGAAVRSATHWLEISYDSLPTIYTDEYGRCVKSGDPYFPVGFYDNTTLNPSPTARMDTLVANYDNIRLLWHGQLLNITEGQRTTLMDDMASRGLYHMFNLASSFAATIADPIWSTFQTLVDAHKEHAAMFGWSLVDERSADFIPLLKARYDYLKGVSNLPVWVNLTGTTTVQYPEYHPGHCDIQASDTYPVYGADAASVLTTNLNALASALMGCRMMWAVLECATIPGGSAATPTQAQMSCQLFQSLIAGARGLFYYRYDMLLTDGAPQVAIMQAIDSLIGRALEFAVGLDMANADQTTCNSGDILLLTRECTRLPGGGTIYTTCVANPTAAPIEATFTVHGILSGWGEALHTEVAPPNTSQIVADSWTDTIEAGGIRLYEYNEVF